MRTHAPSIVLGAVAGGLALLGGAALAFGPSWMATSQDNAVIETGSWTATTNPDGTANAHGQGYWFASGSGAPKATARAYLLFDADVESSDTRHQVYLPRAT